MDPATQGLLGAAAAQSLFSKRIGRHVWLIGMVAAMVPDLDIVIRSADNPSLLMIYHRHFTHSLSFIPFGGLLVGLGFLAARPALRPYGWAVILASIVAFATHGPLDLLTSFGTILFWPFSTDRLALDWISIVDPVFTLILMAGVVIAAIQEKAKPAIIALALCLCYISFGAYQHHRAYSMQQQMVVHRGQVAIKGRVMPSLGNLFGWRSVYIADEQVYLDTIHTPLLHDAYGVKGQSFALFTRDRIPMSIKRNYDLAKDYEVFSWFSDGYLTAMSESPLLLVDLRYVIWRSPLTALWGVEFPNPQERKHVYWRRNLML